MAVAGAFAGEEIAGNGRPRIFEVAEDVPLVAIQYLSCLDLDGDITLDGQRLSRLSRSDLARLRNRRVGFIFQSPELKRLMGLTDRITLAPDT